MRWLAVWTAAVLSFPLVSLYGDTPLQFIPVAAIALTFIACAPRLPERWIVAFFGLWLAMLYGALFALLAPRYDPGKLTLFIGVVALFGVMLGVCLRDRRILEQVPTAFLLIGCTGIALLTLDPVAVATGRFAFSGSSPIWLGRTISLAGIAAVWFICRGRPIFWPVLLASLFAIVLTGSRGPTVGLIAAAGYGLLFRREEGRAPTIAIVTYAVTMIALLGVIPTDLRVFTGSDSGRMELYSYALDIIREVPEGIGIGHYRYGIFIYPHNILLEFLAEWGWLLGGAWIAIIGLGGTRLLMMPREYDILKLAFIADFLNSQFSGDVTSPRLLYALVFIGLLPARHRVWLPTHPS